MSLPKFLATMAVFLMVGSFALGDWTETNNDGGVGGLDYLPYWFAAYNGSLPKPATAWYEAGQPPIAGFGNDPGWYDNVIGISDADATVFAAANHVETFTDVRVTVACTTTDLDEEFGVMARMSHFNADASIIEVDGYAATFSANDADEVGDPLKFSLYKIVDGGIADSEVVYPILSAPFPNDFIFSVELTVVGGQITARLYEDTGDASPLTEVSMTDSSPLPAGYSGALSLDVYTADGISAFYDTLVSETIPEPGTLTLLAAGLLVGLLPRRCSRNR